MNVGIKKLDSQGLPNGESRVISSFELVIPACDRQRDGRTRCIFTAKSKDNREASLLSLAISRRSIDERDKKS